MTVLLLTHPGGPVALQALDALAAQTRIPDGVVLTGLDPVDDEVVQVRAHPLVAGRAVDLVVLDPVRAPAATEPPLWQVVAEALTAVPEGPGSWVWLLHDDSVPEPTALEQLLEAARRSTGVGVVGPKLVQAADPRRLVAVGHAATRGGRSADASVTGQLDQGQYDQRSDVLGVPTPGMLVRAEVFRELGGFDPVLDEGVEGLDLSWRSHLRGHRVVVAPAAVVRQGERGLGTGAALRTRRRLRQAALARDTWWTVPLRALAILVTSLLAALGLLLVKRPREAAAELADASAVLLPWRAAVARWRFRGRRRVRHRDLHGLFAPAAAGWRTTTDVLHDALTPGSGRALAGREPVAPESGPVAEEARSLDPGSPRGRWWSWPLVAALVIGVLAALTRWRGLWPALAGGGYGVQGPEVAVVDADAAAVWHSWWDAWRGAGLGRADGAEPWLLPAAAATWVLEQLPWTAGSGSPAALATAWLLVAAVPLAVLSAYAATRTVLSSRTLRAVTALVWAGLPPLTEAVADGRLGPALVHVLAPLVVAGFVVAADRGEGPARTAATFATALLVALAGMLTPAVLVLSTVAGLLLVARGPGWVRARGLVLAALPWALQGPWLADAWHRPLLLLGGPGATTTQPAVAPWQTLLLHPGGPSSPALWWTVPLLVLALLAAVRTGPRGRRIAVLLTGALLGLTAALAAPLLRVGTVPVGEPGAGAVVTAWPGGPLSLAAACLLLAAAASVDGILSRGHAGPRGVRSALGVAAGVAAVAGLATLAWAAWAGTGPTLTAAPAPYPAVVEEQARGPEAVRLLELLPAGDEVRYRLVGREPDPWLRDRTRELAGPGPGPGAGEQQLDETVRTLVGQPGSAGGTDGHEGLHALAVGYVGLRATVEHPLVEQLDTTAGLTRLGAPDGLVLWRVAAADGGTLVSASRVTAVDAAGEPVATVPVSGAHAVLERGAHAPQGAVAVEVSQGSGWADRAVVRVDGVVADAEPGQWPLRYPLEARTGPLSVELPPADRTWHLVTAALAGLTAFLALPLGTGRRRGTP